jgi:hypothetical protein
MTWVTSPALGRGKDLSMYGFENHTRAKHVMHYIEG